MAGSAFDYDVIVIGSGFGGSVAALRATEKGYRVGVMESGRRWNDEDLPHTSWDMRKFLWQPELEMFGIQRMEYLEDVFVLCGAGKLYAFDDLCTHDSVPLSAGLLMGTTLMCQCDGSQFDVTTGRVLRGPAALALVTYEVREQDGEIQVRV